MIAAALAMRPLLARLLSGPRVWRAVSAAGSVVMTLFLWHMTAFLAVVVLLAGTGYRLVTKADATWWAERPVFVLLSALALSPLVWAFPRFERRAPAAPA